MLRNDFQNKTKRGICIVSLVFPHVILNAWIIFNDALFSVRMYLYSVMLFNFINSIIITTLDHESIHNCNHLFRININCWIKGSNFFPVWPNSTVIYKSIHFCLGR